MQLPLNALRTFEAVASRLSFSNAASDLNVTPAAVSSQIRILEERLNQPLFNRHGRKVSLTEAGRLLLPGVQRGLSELVQAVNLLEEDRSQGILNVTMMPSFLQKWLTPQLAGFYANHENIDLRINADLTIVNFNETDFHAGIRFGRGEYSGLSTQKILDDWTLPVCSPELLEEIGPVKSVEDLSQQHLLHMKDEPWEVWFGALVGESPKRRGPTFDDSMSIVTAAEMGLGIALARWSLVAKDLAAGRLVRPLPLTVKSEFAYYFVSPPHYYDMPKVQQFRDWLEECCRVFPTPE